MEQSEPTTDEIVRALRDAPNYNGMRGTTTTVEDIAADRLESQEKTIAALTARAEQAEKELDEERQEHANDLFRLDRAEERIEQADRERDAAIKALTEYEDALYPTVEDVMRDLNTL